MLPNRDDDDDDDDNDWEGEFIQGAISSENKEVTRLIRLHNAHNALSTLTMIDIETPTIAGKIHEVMCDIQEMIIVLEGQEVDGSL